MQILASGAEKVFNIGTKTGDVGKFFFFRWHLAKATTSNKINNDLILVQTGIHLVSLINHILMYMYLELKFLRGHR